MMTQSGLVGSTATRQVTITIFPAFTNAGCGGGSCSCSPRSSDLSAGFDLTQAFIQKLDENKGGLGTDLQVEVMQYTTVPQLQQAVDRLKLVLDKSGHADVVLKTNLVDLLAGSTPILAVDDVLVTAGGFPAIDQLIAYIRTI